MDAETIDKEVKTAGDAKEIVEEAAAQSLTGVETPEAAEALREDQIQNAIAFLNHPKVMKDFVSFTDSKQLHDCIELVLYMHFGR